ncbi:MAG TPA: MFS transporter [Actinopolymorphaceae bacterium]|nr:MFS transporter [Actinopolymorphaceae bacterium]
MSEQVTLRSIGLRVYLPSVLYGVGQGAIAPVIALSALGLGASAGVASLIVGLAGLGQLVGDLPAGALAGRVGERRAMLAAAGLLAAGLVVCIVATAIWMLGLAICCTGMAGAVWNLARQAYLTEVVPFHLRARALSTLGGVHRIGMFIGPFLGAAAVHIAGTDGPYGLHIIVTAVAAVALMSLPDPGGRDGGVPLPSTLGTVGMARAHLPVLRTLGMGTVLVGAVRASRQAVIPLWAEHIGLDAATTSLVFGVSGAVDMLLFYPAGKVMDRIGRAFVAVPSMLVLGLAHLLLPFTQTTAALFAVAMIMGVGNGIGSGIIMTLGADLSPSAGRTTFLGAWRLCSDAGASAGPLAIGAVTAVASLAPAVFLMGGLGLVGAWMLGRWIPRHVPSPRRVASSGEPSTG